MLPILVAQAQPADDLSGYLPAAIAILLGGVIAVALVGLVTAIGTRPKSMVKSMPFEAGSVPLGGAWRRVNVKYYVVALLFIVFDLETVFLFIWAPIFRDLGGYGLAVMSLFLLLLVVGLAYEWRKGALEWAEEKD